MAKLKLTKGELKKQRDALWQYERYLPTLQLKKQQLQLEVLRQRAALEKKKEALLAKEKAAQVWSGFLTEAPDIKQWLSLKQVITGSRNIAGVNLPVFEQADFAEAEYDLFVTPFWVDAGIEVLRAMVSLNEEIKVIERGLHILRQELRITSQRVNLFEKVKIPEAKEAIRLIKIYIGDQMANAVGRSKIAKAKIEEAVLEEAAV